MPFRSTGHFRRIAGEALDPDVGTAGGGWRPQRRTASVSTGQSRRIEGGAPDPDGGTAGGA